MVRWCRRNYADTCDCVYCERERERQRHQTEGVSSVKEADDDER